MNDDTLYDLTNIINDVEDLEMTTADKIALLQARAIAALAEQMNQLGTLIEDLTTPAASRWHRIKMRLCHG